MDKVKFSKSFFENTSSSDVSENPEYDTYDDPEEKIRWVSISVKKVKEEEDSLPPLDENKNNTYFLIGQDNIYSEYAAIIKERGDLAFIFKGYRNYIHFLKNNKDTIKTYKKSDTLKIVTSTLKVEDSDEEEKTSFQCNNVVKLVRRKMSFKSDILIYGDDVDEVKKIEDGYEGVKITQSINVLKKFLRID